MNEIVKSLISCCRVIRVSKRKSILLSLLAGFLITAACITPDRPQGWSKGIVIGDKYYTGTLEGEVVSLAISPKTDDVDREIHRYTLKGQEGMRAIYSDLVVSSDLSNESSTQVFFSGYDGNLYVLNEDLVELDHIQVGDGSPLVGTVTVVDDVVFLGSSNSNVYAFQIYRDGKKLSLDQKWVFSTGGMIWSRPIVSQNIVYIGSLDHKMYALDKNTGEELWSFETNGGIVTAGLIEGNDLYFGSLDAVFYSLDKNTGELQDKYEEAAGWYWSDPILDEKENTIFIAVLDGRVHAIGYDKGRFSSKWIAELEYKIVSQLSLVDSWIAVASEDGSVVMVKKDNGKSSRRCRLNSEVRAGIYHYDGVLYVSAYDHSVRALRVLGHKEKPDGRFQEVWTYFTNRDYTQAFDEHPPAC